MRHINIADLAPPPDWQARSDAARDGLRAEVTRAAQEARAAGRDEALARRRAIRDGLKRSDRRKVWKDLAPCLANLSKGKCWYSEAKNPGSDKNVDHFRPKAALKGHANHEGYWWLAFDWRNFRYACQWCNQARRDRVNGTAGGKGSHFPLRPGSFRARHEGDRHELERPVLLDPIHRHDCELLTFRPDGHATPARREGTYEHERARASIETYHLHCREMVEGRKILATRVRRVVAQMEVLHPKIVDCGVYDVYTSLVSELLGLLQEEAEYSAAALACARNEVFVFRHGNTRKRYWLEDILNACP